MIDARAVERKRRSVSPLDERMPGSIRLAVVPPRIGPRCSAGETEQRLSRSSTLRGWRAPPHICPSMRIRLPRCGVERRILQPADPERDVGAPLQQVDDASLLFSSSSIREAFAVRTSGTITCSMNGVGVHAQPPRRISRARVALSAVSTDSIARASCRNARPSSVVRAGAWSARSSVVFSFSSSRPSEARRRHREIELPRLP